MSKDEMRKRDIKKEKRILELFQKGNDRDYITKIYKYKNWKGLDMFMRRRGYVWDGDQYTYVKKVAKMVAPPMAISAMRYGAGFDYKPEAAEALLDSMPSADVPFHSLPIEEKITALMADELSDPREVARKLGFADHLEMADHMKAKGYLWVPDLKNYTKETEGGLGTAALSYTLTNAGCLAKTTDSPIIVNETFEFSALQDTQNETKVRVSSKKEEITGYLPLLQQLEQYWEDIMQTVHKEKKKFHLDTHQSNDLYNSLERHSFERAVSKINLRDHTSTGSSINVGTNINANTRSVSISDNLLSVIDLYARKHGITRKRIVEVAVAEYLKCLSSSE